MADAQVTLGSRVCYQEGNGGHTAHCCLDQRRLHPQGRPAGLGPPRCSPVEESSAAPFVWEVLPMSCSGGQSQERIGLGQEGSHMPGKAQVLGSAPLPVCPFSHPF